jgi:hypothetical protein
MHSFLVSTDVTTSQLLVVLLHSRTTLHANQGNQLHLCASVIYLQFCSLDLESSLIHIFIWQHRTINDLISISSLVEINKCAEMLLGGTNTEWQKPTSKNYPRNQGQCHTYILLSH